MNFDLAVSKLLMEEGVELSTMMKTPCLRYRGEFLTMIFEKENALIIKVAPERVSDLIAEGKGKEFNFTKKRFKEWVLIPSEFEDKYEEYIHEAFEYAKKKR